MVLGILGKIASGKSEVLKILRKKGFYCIEGDKIVHDIYAKDAEGSQRIAAIFGSEFLKESGEVNRDKLRNVVFKNLDKLKMLNNIIHPVVYEEVVKLLKKHSSKDVVIELVYFDQDFLSDFVNKVLWIERSRDEILKILIEERSFNPEIAENAFESIGCPLKVDFVLKNNGSIEDLENSIGDILKNIL